MNSQLTGCVAVAVCLKEKQGSDELVIALRNIEGQSVLTGAIREAVKAAEIGWDYEPDQTVAALKRKGYEAARATGNRELAVYVAVDLEGGEKALLRASVTFWVGI